MLIIKHDAYNNDFFGYSQAWVGERPILGDKSYDGGGKAKLLRENGLYLCSNKVTLEHPYYNTPQGRKEWNEMKERGVNPIECLLRDFGNVNVGATEESDGLVLIHAEIDLPGKFNEF